MVKILILHNIISEPPTISDNMMRGKQSEHRFASKKFHCLDLLLARHVRSRYMGWCVVSQISNSSKYLYMREVLSAADNINLILFVALRFQELLLHYRTANLLVLSR